MLKLVGLLGAGATAIVVAVVVVGPQICLPTKSACDSWACRTGDYFDFNGSLPGTGRPWLWNSEKPQPVVPNAARPPGCDPGFFDAAYSSTEWIFYYIPRVPTGADGCPLDFHEPYRRLIAVLPDLGGSLPHQMTAEEIAAAGLSMEPSDILFSDGPVAKGDHSHLYRLGPPVVPQHVKDDAHAEAAAQAAAQPRCLALLPASTTPPTPSGPTPTPEPSGETQRWRVSLNGYEMQEMDPMWKSHAGYREGIRFDYRLVGEFEVTRATPFASWTVVSTRLATATVTYSSLYPTDQFKVTLTCVKTCDLMDTGRIGPRQLTVTPIGDNEVSVGWGPGFHPEVHLTGTCTGCSKQMDYYTESSGFWSLIDARHLPLQDRYSDSPAMDMNASGDYTVSFTYGLEQLP